MQYILLLLQYIMHRVECATTMMASVHPFFYFIFYFFLFHSFLFLPRFARASSHYDVLVAVVDAHPKSAPVQRMYIWRYCTHAICIQCERDLTVHIVCLYHTVEQCCCSTTIRVITYSLSCVYTGTIGKYM